MRLLIVGGGRIGERHLRCFLKARKSLNVTLAEPRAARRRELAAKYPLEGVTGDLNELDLGEFGAAVLATPADLHIAHARLLARAGCHLLIEKPLCVTEAGVPALVSLVKRRNLVVLAGYTYRCYPQIEEIARLVRCGRVGPVLAARATMAYDYRSVARGFARSYFASHDTGGGAINDMASHLIAVMTWMLGEVLEVTATAGRHCLRGVSVEDTANLSLRFATGALCDIFVSAWQPKRWTGLEVIGPDGHLAWRNDFVKRGMTLKHAPGGERPWETISRKSFDADEPFVRQAKNFLAAIAGREPVRCSLADALHVHGVCRAALVSAKRGRRAAVK